MGSTLPGGYSTVIIKTSLPENSGRSFEVSGVTEACGALLASGCWAISVPVMRQNTTSKNILFITAPLDNFSVFLNQFGSRAELSRHVRTSRRMSRHSHLSPEAWRARQRLYPVMLEPSLDHPRYQRPPST